MAMLEMSVITLKGDTKITWDSDNAAEVENARRTFDSLKQQGFTAHLPGNTGARVQEFDPNAEGLVMVPVMTAG